MRPPILSTAAGVALLLAWLGCGALVTEPGVTGTTTGSTTTGGTGGAATSSTGAIGTGGTGATGTGGTGGGACAGACPSCAAFTPWSRAFSTPGESTNTLLLGAGLAMDGSLLLTTGLPLSGSRLLRIAPDGQTVGQPDSIGWLVASDGGCGGFLQGGVKDQASVLGTVASCAGFICPYLARFDAGGAPVWLHVYETGPNVGWDPGGLVTAGDQLVASGYVLEGAIDLGTGPIAVLPGGSTSFVAAFSPDDGHTLWTRQAVTKGSAIVFGGLAVSPAGDIAVAGAFLNAIDFGDGFVPSPAGPSWSSTFVVLYDATGGLRFTKVFGQQGASPQGWSVAFDAAGHVVLAGPVLGATDLGAGPVGVPGEMRTIVAKLDPQGNPLFAVALGDSDDFSGALAVDGGDRIWVSGNSGVRVLDAMGTLVENHPFGGSGARHTTFLGFGPGGAPVVGGTFDGTLDLGQGLLDAGGSNAAFAGVLGL